MEKIQKKFITIGELSKLTGVNAKSLRYYDKIGVLPPAYIDSDNGYRYYTHSQMSLVYSIQFYITLGIPLTEMFNFINKESGAINFKKHISYAAEVAANKIQQLEREIRITNFLINELDRSDRILYATEPVKDDLPEKTCWTQPISGRLTTQSYYSNLKRTWAEIRNSGNGIGSETGILYIDGKCYVFADVRVVGDIPTKVIRIPAQSYLSTKTKFDDFDIEYFGDVIPNIVILSELFVSEYDYNERLYELRWSTAYNGSHSNTL